jgi:hypothetical protein
MKVSNSLKVATVFTIVLCLTILTGTALADAPPSTPTAITIALSTKSIALGSNVTVSGSVIPSVSGLSPVSDATVTITYTKPDGTKTSTVVTSGSDGSFNYTYVPNLAGSWSVTANWAGDTTYLGATSSTEQFVVTDSLLGGISLTYLYIIIAIIAIMIAAIAVYLYKRKNQRPLQSTQPQPPE